MSDPMIPTPPAPPEIQLPSVMIVYNPANQTVELRGNVNGEENITAIIMVGLQASMQNIFTKLKKNQSNIVIPGNGVIRGMKR